MKHRITAVALVAPVILLLGACSTPAPEPTGDVPAQVKIAFLGDISGAASFCGAAAQQGVEQAVAKINEDGLLGETELLVDYVDTTTDPTVAATEMSNIAASDAVGVVIGCASGVSQASAPVAQSSGLPVVAMQSGTQAVIDTGDFVFRATAPQSTYHGVQVDHYAEEGATTAAIIYQADNPTLTELATAVYPDLLEGADIELVATETFQGADLDFTALASKVVDTDPDVIFIFGQGTPNVTIATQVLDRGYDGFIGGSAGFAGGVLEPLGDRANGFTWPTDFNVNGDAASTQEFVTYYTDATGEEPGGFQAEAWDATMILAAGIAAAENKTDRTSVRDGLVSVTGSSFDGAVGEITFDGRDARIGGLLVEWRDGAAQLVE